LYISLHADPSRCYPGQGFANEIGIGKGKGYNVPIPLPIGTTDREYLDKLESAKAEITTYKPEFIIISAGFDSYRGDPVGMLGLSRKCFGEIGKFVKGIAEKHTNGKLVSVLEGGYSEELPGCVHEYLRVWI
jgi:acetoin utilization deacetylase AcuC-like enzyme